MLSGSSFTPLHLAKQRPRSSFAQQYRFAGQEASYDLFRPHWNLAFTRLALEKAGIKRLPDGHWQGTINGEAPVIVSMGAGTGSDAAAFKQLGCKVILVEPNAKFLEIAKVNMEEIAEGEAVYIHSDAMNTTIAPQTVDLIVIAQALHTLKQPYASQFLTNAQKCKGLGTEELSRQHWQILLPQDSHHRISIWYYNLDPKQSITTELNDLLLTYCIPYRNSQTKLLNANFFEPNHFQPWIARPHLDELASFELQHVVLERHQVGDWLCSYSFKPAQADFVRMVRILQEQWFDKFQKDGFVYLPYLGYCAQGPLRSDPFPMEDIDYPIAAQSPLNYPVQKIYQLPRAKL